MSEAKIPALNTEEAINDILGTIEREREREIVARRFGLFERKETLEQIGELLGITRERVRQLEKTVLSRLKTTAEQGKLPHVTSVQEHILAELRKVGNAARVSELASHLGVESTRTEQSRVAFLAQLCPDVTLIEEDDHHYLAVVSLPGKDTKQIKALVSSIVATIKELGKPVSVNEVIKQSKLAEPAPTVQALASISKNLASLKGVWGLIKWPTVNPKNIRDKIYVILKDHGKHMHFNDIADTIKASNFKRKDVTTQAIHNELIKDKRFVLVGRGIYALKEWGYEKGTVSDIITTILRKEGAALHRDEIVKRVLQSRYVKETTILLNLQGKAQFKRVAKATYTLEELSEA